jgi:hypothetical protein
MGAEVVSAVATALFKAVLVDDDDVVVEVLPPRVERTKGERR